jgi:hypothetical protein
MTEAIETKKIGVDDNSSFGHVATTHQISSDQFIGPKSNTFLLRPLASRCIINLRNMSRWSWKITLLKFDAISAFLRACTFGLVYASGFIFISSKLGNIFFFTNNDNTFIHLRWSKMLRRITTFANNDRPLQTVFVINGM